MPEKIRIKRFNKPGVVAGTVAGRDIPSLVAAGRLDFEDEYLDSSDGRWLPIWQFPGVSPPARWDALRRSRASDMARQLDLARQGSLTREEYLRWREMQLARIGTEGAPTLVHSSAGGTAAEAEADAWADGSIPDHVRATWEYIREIGHGGTGRVHLVRNRHTGVKCALKVTRPEMPREAVLNELTSLEQIRSPHVVQVRHYEQLGDGRWLIVTEHVPGPTLREHLLSLPGKRVGEATEVRRLLLGIARGLADLHRQGLVHRDLKPANIMLRQEPPGHGAFTPVIIDLGMARGAQPVGMTILGGTSGYQSPEQQEGRPCTPASDVFTFGLIAYELVAGKKMAGGRLVALHDICPGVPAALDKLLKEDCASDEEDERPPDGTALLARLDEAWSRGEASPLARAPTETPTAGSTTQPEARPTDTAQPDRAEPPACPAPPEDAEELFRRGLDLDDGSSGFGQHESGANERYQRDLNQELIDWLIKRYGRTGFVLIVIVGCVVIVAVRILLFGTE